MAGHTGFVRLIVNFSEKGAVTNITTVGMEQTEDEDPSNNLVVIGYGNELKAASDFTAAPFTQELDRVINALAPFTPAKVNGKPTAVRLSFDVQFKLE